MTRHPPGDGKRGRRGRPVRHRLRVLQSVHVVRQQRLDQARHAGRADRRRGAAGRLRVGGSIGTSLLNTVAAVVASGYITAHAASVTSAASKQLVEANSLLDSYHTVSWAAAGIYAGVAVLCALLLRSGVAIPRDGSGSEPSAAAA